MSVADRLFEARQRLAAQEGVQKVSQEEIARRCGWEGGGAQSRYQKYEKGERKPGLEELVTLARVFRTTPEWLAFGVTTGSPHEPPTPDNTLSDMALRAARMISNFKGEDDQRRCFDAVVQEVKEIAAEANQDAKQKQELADNAERLSTTEKTPPG